MSDIMQKLIELIKAGKTINELTEELHLSHKQIYSYLNILSNKGFDFDRKYYYTGDIAYIPKTTFIENNDINIYTAPDDTEFKAVLISDLHLGSKHQKPEYIDMVFDYCTKEGINIILCGGDFLDGTLAGSGKKIHDTPSEQIEYALQRYPYDKNILTFTVLGNHDLSILTETGQDFAKVLNNSRHDIISTGYGIGEVNVKNDKIFLKHSIAPFNPVSKPFTHALYIKGHSHRMGIETSSSGACIITIPTLSNLIKDGFPPGFVKMNLAFKNGWFKTGHFEQLMIYYNRIIRVNNINCTLVFGKSKDFAKEEEIKLEEDRPKKRILTIDK